MSKVIKITTGMTPALEINSQKSSVGDIDSVPAVRVELIHKDQIVQTVGLIDTGSDICFLDRKILNRFKGQIPVISKMPLVTGVSNDIIELDLIHLDINISGDDPEKRITLDDVPVLIGDLDRPYLLIGRRGFLEWLEVSLDFPKNLISLVLRPQSAALYPTLSKEFSSLASVLKLFREKKYAEGIYKLAWDMERYVDWLISEDQQLKRIIEELPSKEKTMGEKLRLICEINEITDISVEVQEFIEVRNRVAHTSSFEISRISTRRILRSAELIVNRISQFYLKP